MDHMVSPPAEERDALEAAAEDLAHAIFSDDFGCYSTARAVRNAVLAIMRSHGLRGPARCICTDGCDPACDIHGGVM